MLFPKCNRCGGPSESAESDNIEYAGRHMRHWLHGQALAGHPHPLIKSAGLLLGLGSAIYKRLPGGGLKRCTRCHHEFS